MQRESIEASTKPRGNASLSFEGGPLEGNVKLTGGGRESSQKGIAGKGQRHSLISESLALLMLSFAACQIVIFFPLHPLWGVNKARTSKLISHNRNGSHLSRTEISLYGTRD